MKLLVLLAIAALIAGCGASAPTPAQEARVGSYTAALGACDTKLAVEVQEAKAAKNADRAVLLARYEACAHAVDVAWGRAK